MVSLGPLLEVEGLRVVRETKVLGLRSYVEERMVDTIDRGRIPGVTEYRTLETEEQRGVDERTC